METVGYAKLAACALALLCTLSTQAQEAAPAYDAARAQTWGANEQGLHPDTFVPLKTGPKRMPDGPERDAMFKGDFTDMERLAKVGPLDGQNGLRGIFIFATKDVDVARQAVETDAVITHGEMVADIHRHFGSAALLAVNEWHPKLIKPTP